MIEKLLQGRKTQTNNNNQSIKYLNDTVFFLKNLFSTSQNCNVKEHITLKLGIYRFYAF